MNHDDDKFMAQFTNRLNLEPAPQWNVRRREFPWLELGWAFAAALALGVYFSELKFGLFCLYAVVHPLLVHLPVSWIFMGGTLIVGGIAWLAPKIAEEL